MATGAKSSYDKALAPHLRSRQNRRPERACERRPVLFCHARLGIAEFCADFCGRKSREECLTRSNAYVLDNQCVEMSYGGGIVKGGYPFYVYIPL